MLKITRTLKRVFRFQFGSVQEIVQQAEIQEEFQSQAFEVQTPVFPLTKHVIQLTNKGFEQMAKNKKLYITTIVKTGDGASEDLKLQFHSVGTYCSAVLQEKTFQMIINGIQRVQIQNLKHENYSPVISIQTVQDAQAEVESQQELIPAGMNGRIHMGETDEEESEDIISNIEELDSQASNQSREIPYKNVMVEAGGERLLMATVKLISEPKFQMDIAVESQLKHLIDIYSKILYMNRAQVPLVNYNFADAYRIIDSLGGFLTNLRYYDKKIMQETLETLPLADRLEKVHGLMTKYLVFLQYYSDVGQLAQQNIQAKKAQEFYDEMFKIVKGAVEGKKGKEAVIEQMALRFQQTKAPENVKKIFLEESQRYLQLDNMSSESNMLRTYLEWMSSIPYGVLCQENSDLVKAKECLDQDHYGMDDIKERILEFIAVSSLSSKTKGRILLLVGPPGVGKTSLASSIAKAVGRPFARVSLGGESDVSFLKGHRRTYIGAYPGKIVESLKAAQKQNCVILLDEVDKLGRSDFYGDPSSNLLEILDPEQNQNFTDNYLDYPIDLSKVLFICSANTTQSIQKPLLDRMDIIELSSYTSYEKKQIYERHLLRKALQDSGITENHKYKIEPNIVDVLIKDYCREPGVRSLEKYTRKITDKIAYNIINEQENQHEQKEVVITVKDLPSIIGQPRFSDFKVKKFIPGIVTGLAYTEYGGSLLFLEATQSQFIPRGQTSRLVTPGLKVTGSLGDVMQESIQIAYTFAKMFSFQFLNNQFLEQNEVHVHAPEGAIPKDGPSAGITITTSLLSLALNTPIPNDLGMTGELSLNGLVLPIGGCKEKILAAQREGLKRLIFPERNRPQIMKLKKEVVEGIQILFVKEYKDVFEIVFPKIQQQRATPALAFA